MIRSWLNKLSRAFGGDRDAEDQEDGDKSSKTEPTEEGEITEPDGVPTEAGDSQGDPKAAVDSQGGPTEAAVDSQGGPTEAASDSQGDPKAAVDSQGGPTEAGDSQGDPKAAVDSQGGPTEAAVDSQGGPTEAASDSQGDPKAAVDSQGGPTEAASDSQGDPKAAVDSQGVPTEEVLYSRLGPTEGDPTLVAVDSQGDPKAAVDSQGGPTQAAADSQGDPTLVAVDSQGDPTEVAEDSQGDPKAAVDSIQPVCHERATCPGEEQSTGSFTAEKEEGGRKKTEGRRKRSKRKDLMPDIKIRSSALVLPSPSTARIDVKDIHTSKEDGDPRKKAIAQLKRVLKHAVVLGSDDKTREIVMAYRRKKQQSELLLSEVKNESETEVQEAGLIISEVDALENSEVKDPQAGGEDGKEENFSKQERSGGVSEEKEEETKEDPGANIPEYREEEREETEDEKFIKNVIDKTSKGLVIPSKHLVYKLGLLKVDPKFVEMLLLEQYKVAVKNEFAVWIEHCRYHAELIFSPTWIAENMPRLGTDAEREKRRLQSRNERRAKRNEKENMGMCRDVRLKTQPKLGIARYNAATGESMMLKDEDLKEGQLGPDGQPFLIMPNGERITVYVSRDYMQEPWYIEKKRSLMEQVEQWKLNESHRKVGDGNGSEPEKGESKKSSPKHDDNGKQRKKLSPCQKEKPVETREIDNSACEVEGMEKIEDSGSHSVRERRKSEVYDKRKDRVDDSVSRESKKPKTEQDGPEAKTEQDGPEAKTEQDGPEAKTEQDKPEAETVQDGPEDSESKEGKLEVKEIPVEDKHSAIDQEASSSSATLSQEVEVCASEINQSSIDAPTQEENYKALKTESSNEEHPSGLTESPNLTESSKGSSVTTEDTDTTPVLAQTSLPESSETKKASGLEKENPDLEDKSENKISSLSHVSETDADSETPFIKKDDQKEMRTSASHSSHLKPNLTVSLGDRKEDLKSLETNVQEKARSDHLNAAVCNLPSNLLVSPDCVVSPKFEVPPNTPASDFAEIPQSAKLSNLDVMQDKVKLEKEVADLLSEMTRKLKRPAGSDLEEFHAEESTADASNSPVNEEPGNESKDLPIQSADSAIISADNASIKNISEKELESLDACMKRDLGATEEGRCSPEEYLCMLQQVLPNVTSITKMKSEQEEEKDDIQCGIVSSSTNTKRSSIASQGASAEVDQSPTESVIVGDLLVAENEEIPCKIHTGEEKGSDAEKTSEVKVHAKEEKEISVARTIEVLEELAAEGDLVFTGQDHLSLDDIHKYCLNQSDGVRMVKSMHEGMLSGESTSDMKTSDGNNSEKSSISKSSESDGQFTKLSRTLSKSEEKLKQTTKPPWNSNTKVDNRKSENLTPSRIPKALKTKSTSQTNTKQADEMSKSLEEKNESLSVEEKSEVADICRDKFALRSDSVEVKNEKEEELCYVAEDEMTVTTDGIIISEVHPNQLSTMDTSNSSEKRKNIDQVQKALFEIEKGKCEMDQVDVACETKEMTCQSTQELDESRDSNACASPKPTASESPTPTASESPKPNASESPKPTASASPKPTASASPKPTASASPKPTASTSPKPTASASPKPTASASPKPTASASPKPTASASPASASPSPKWKNKKKGKGRQKNRW